mmetsp:Transcript_19811/g.9217  ORF Transcript_19811/g.9217 Transcript_19811/m.9217 type:complete len:276 (+) Transcript_19811:71-898(+)
MKKNNIEVSVVIPTYNRGWIIKEAVDSVLAQTYKEFELIVVDDGSDDNTQDFLKIYGNKIKIIRQRNLGVSAARNTGIKNALGKFVAFLDSDDLWLPEKLSAQIDFFNSVPDALICQTEEIWIRKGIRVNPKRKHKKLSGMIFEPSLSMCMVSPSAVMVKKSLLDDVKTFDENLQACEDYDLWLRISCKHPIYLLDIPLTIKRGGHNDQLSLLRGLDKFRIISLDKIIKSGVLTNEQKEKAIMILKQKCRIYENGCIKRRKLSEGKYFKNIRKSY